MNTKREILAQVAHEVGGNPMEFILAEWDSITKKHPTADLSDWLRELSEAEAAEFFLKTRAALSTIHDTPGATEQLLSGLSLPSRTRARNMGDPAAVTVRPQIFEAFPEPTSVDEARARREALIREHAAIDEELSVRHDLEWRTKARSDLRRIHAEIRMLKEYLRRNDVAKESEWRLLARAHEMLSRWVTADMAGEFANLAWREDAESLLDAIELVVPGQYLNKEARDGHSRSR